MIFSGTRCLLLHVVFEKAFVTRLHKLLFFREVSTRILIEILPRGKSIFYVYLPLGFYHQLHSIILVIDAETPSNNIFQVCFNRLV